MTVYDTALIFREETLILELVLGGAGWAGMPLLLVLVKEHFSVHRERSVQEVV